MSAEIRANYFADLSRLYHNRQFLTTWAILVCSSAAAWAFVGKLPTDYAWAAPTLSLLTAALSGYALAMQNQQNAVDSANLHFGWNSLAKGYARLWDDMYAEDALAKLTALEERGMELSKSATGFPVRMKRLSKWQNHVEQHHAQAARASAG